MLQATPLQESDDMQAETVKLKDSTLKDYTLKLKDCTLRLKGSTAKLKDIQSIHGKDHYAVKGKYYKVQGQHYT